MQCRSLTTWIRNLCFAGWYYFTNQQMKLSMYAFHSNAALPGRHATMYQVGPRPMLRCTPQRTLCYIAVCLKQPPSCMQQVPFSRFHSGLECFFPIVTPWALAAVGRCAAVAPLFSRLQNQAFVSQRFEQGAQLIMSILRSRTLHFC